MTILFLGNSHVSAFKLATASHDDPLFSESSVYCAKGGDLAYVSLVDGSIRASTTGPKFSKKSLDFFCQDDPSLIQLYCTHNVPTVDVSTQFINTGGQEAIDLSNVNQIFYVAGVSPYDFIRLEKGLLIPYTKTSAQILCDQLLREYFLLRNLFTSIREVFPKCKQHFIGIPLKSQSPFIFNDMHKEIAHQNRVVINQIIGTSDFDSVYMPSETVLSDTLLFTKPEFARDGRQESELFQRAMVTDSDCMHMNKEYGKIVLDEYVKALVKEN